MTWFLTFIFAIGCCVCTAAPTDDELPAYGIVGGLNASIEYFPYQVSVQYKNHHFCGGSIIAPNAVLTAAHCTEGRQHHLFGIRAGATMHSQGGQVVKVKQIIDHPDYSDVRLFNNDISILILESPLKLGSKVQTIKLATGALPYGKMAHVTGWGATTEGGQSAPQLQYADATIFTKKECDGIYGRALTDRMFCAGHMFAGRDSCQGDSGGPLAHNNELIGVVSWGVGCARENSPGVYALVAHFTPWIKNYVKLP